MADDSGLVGERGSRPVPDPTLLTTQALIREIAGLKELVEAKLAIVDEKFAGVQHQFEERDERVKQASIAAETAVNAALQAQKEAAGKANETFEKSIDKSDTSTAKQIDAVINQISDLKERMTRVEGVALGRLNATQENRQQNNWAIGAGIAVISVGVAIVGAIAARGG